MAQKLTQKQERVLNFLKDFMHDSGYPPTMREIADQLALAGPDSAKKFLDILERKGRIRRAARTSRSIELLDSPLPGAPGREIPIVGTIRAGTPALAAENIIGRVTIDPSIARSEGMFFLRVEGDSMIEAHIMSGDLALIRPQPTVEQGEIAAVLLGEEATLKYFYREKDGIRLQPANQTLDPLCIPEDGCGELQILGKVAGVVRNIDW